MKKLIVRFCDALCGLALLSLAAYAFTGFAVWKDVGVDEFGRGILLGYVYLAAILSPLFGRIYANTSDA